MKKKLALLLALAMVSVSVLAGCGAVGSKPLVVGYSNLFQLLEQVLTIFC